MDHNKLLDRIYSNIAWLINIRKKKISEVELAAGVSIGYLVRSKTSNVDLPISKVVLFANYFGVTVDDLINNSYEEMYLKEQIAVLQKRLEEVKSQNKGV